MHTNPEKQFPSNLGFHFAFSGGLVKAALPEGAGRKGGEAILKIKVLRL
jgi:hypothetical protein